MILTLTGNSGGAVGPNPGGNITLVGSGNITITGNPGAYTLTATLTGTTDHAVQVGNASGSLTSLAVGTTGQLLVGNTGADPTWAQISHGNFTFSHAAGLLLPGTILTLVNTSNAASMVGTGPALEFEQNYYDAATPAPVNIGKIAFVTENNWTSTASTQDGKLSIEIVKDGTLQERLAISSDGTVSLDDPLDVAYGGTGVATLTDHGLLVGSGASDITALAAATNGQLPIGSTGADPVLATLTAGSGINITNGAGSVTIAVTGGGLPWNEETGTTVSMAVNYGYIMNNSSRVTGTLPASASVGDIIHVTGKGAGGWKIAQNAGQTIYYGEITTTTGTGGYLQSNQVKDSVEIVCVTANNDWNVISSIGNPQYV